MQGATIDKIDAFEDLEEMQLYPEDGNLFGTKQNELTDFLRAHRSTFT